MRIIHAEWEQRNMGVDCYEVEITPQDTFDDYLKYKDKFESEYTVLRVPSCKPDWFFFLQQEKYSYVENLIHLYHTVTMPELSKQAGKLIKKMTYLPMKKEEIPKLAIQIENLTSVVLLKT